MFYFKFLIGIAVFVAAVDAFLTGLVEVVVAGLFGAVLSGEVEEVVAVAGGGGCVSHGINEVAEVH